MSNNKMIQMNSVEFVSATLSARQAADNLNGELDTWYSQGERSTALEAFAAQYVELEWAMKQYQDLLNADLKTITDIGEKFLLADMKLKELWK